MEHQEENFKADDPAQRLNFAQVGGILTTMGFISSVTVTQSSYKLVEELFELLGGQTAQEDQDPEAEQEGEKKQEVGVKIDDLSYILLVINGSKMPEREVESACKEDAQGIFKSVAFEGDGEQARFAIRKGGQAKIHAHFLNFYSSRMGFDGRPKPKEDPALQELQDAPLISARSKKIAEEARKKLLGEQSNQDIVTQLYEKEKLRSQQKQLLAQEITQRSIENEQSTFRPVTNHFN